MAARDAALIRVDAVWLAVEPLDMRAGTEAALRRVVAVLFASRPHHAYLFANRRANRIKVLVHDGIGVWLAARRLNAGRFVWPRDVISTLNLNRAQFDALALHVALLCNGVYAGLPEKLMRKPRDLNFSRLRLAIQACVRPFVQRETLS